MSWVDVDGMMIPLLTRFLFRFVPRYSRNVSVVSDDSGFAPDSASSSGKEFKFPSSKSINLILSHLI